MRSRRVALSIAGSDPTGGAGLQLDLQVFHSLGVHGCAVPTALTVQDTGGVREVLPAFPSVVLSQLRTLTADLRPDAVKIGMLATDDVLRAVELVLDGFDETIPIVLDPVLRASDGTPLLESRATAGLIRLLRRATLVTPNRPELEALAEGPVDSPRQVEQAARLLVESRGARAVLAKGGHAEGPADDLLAMAEDGGTRLCWLEGPRLETGPVHGTGCALSAAIAAGLARGLALEPAVARARAYVRAALERAWSAGAGARLLGLPEAGTAERPLGPSEAGTAELRAPEAPGVPTRRGAP